MPRSPESRHMHNIGCPGRAVSHWQEAELMCSPGVSVVLRIQILPDVKKIIRQGLVKIK